MSTGAGDLFQLLRDGQVRTRADVMDETGLARTTVAVKVAALMQLGFVTHAGIANSSGGRPPSRFSFNPTARVIIGIDLGATHGTVGITNLHGEVLARTHHTLDIADGPDTVLTLALDSATELLESLNRDVTSLLGIGVGVPGPVQHATGRPMRPPIMPGWDGFDIPRAVRERLDVPVLVDNDVNLLALGEHATVWPTVSDLLFIKVATGIGAGVIAGGVLQRGASGSAGDIGHAQVPHGIGELDLEAIASGPAIAARITDDDAVVGASEVVDLIRKGDPLAVAAAREAGRAIGEVTAVCVSLLNPATVVIGGALGQQVQEVIAGVREVVYRRSIPLATQNLSIVPAQGGVDAGVRGAALMVIEDRLSAAAIDELLEQGR